MSTGERSLASSKWCPPCGTKHTLRAFGRKAGTADGLRGVCRKAHAARERARTKPKPAPQVAPTRDPDWHPVPKPAIGSVRRLPTVERDPDVEMIVGVFDEHHPEIDPDYRRASRALIRYLQPDGLIIGGDFGDWQSGSSHVPDAFRPSVQSDEQVCDAALGELRECVGPDAWIKFLCGNHETALLRLLSQRLPAQVAGFWDKWREACGLNRHRVDFVTEDKQPLKIGKLRALHGHQVGRMLPKHHAAKLAQEWGGPGLTVVAGHAHREGMSVFANREGNSRAYFIAAGRFLPVSWSLNANGWSNGLAVIMHRRSTGDVAVFPVPLVGGVMLWDGRVFGLPAAS